VGVPNAFSPNGDGINDVVKVEGKGIVKLIFRIFNRWGEKVFETTDKNIGWDGYYKGVLQEMEVYTYSVQAELINGDIIPLKGNITLLR
jgi:gliding motility-associated-like protein